MACPGRRARALFLIYKESMGGSPKRGAPRNTRDAYQFGMGNRKPKNPNVEGCPPEALPNLRRTRHVPAFAIRHQDSSCGSAGWFEAGFRGNGSDSESRSPQPTGLGPLDCRPVSPPVSLPLPTNSFGGFRQQHPPCFLSERTFAPGAGKQWPLDLFLESSNFLAQCG